MWTSLIHLKDHRGSQDSHFGTWQHGLGAFLWGHNQVLNPLFCLCWRSLYAARERKSTLIPPASAPESRVQCGENGLYKVMISYKFRALKAKKKRAAESENMQSNFCLDDDRRLKSRLLSKSCQNITACIAFYRGFSKPQGGHTLWLFHFSLCKVTFGVIIKIYIYTHFIFGHAHTASHLKVRV